MNSRNVVTIAIIGLVTSSVEGLFRPFIPVYAYSLGLNLQDLGTAVTLSMLFSSLILPLLGRIMDIKGRKLGIMISTMFLSLSPLVAIAARDMLLILLAYFFLFLSFMSEMSARGAILSESVPEEELGRAFGKVMTVRNVPRLIIPLSAGFLITVLGFHTTFGLASAIGLVALVIAYRMVSETFGNDYNHVLVTSRTRDLFLPEKGLIHVYVMASLDRVAWFVWFPLLNAYVVDVFKVNATMVGLLVFVMNLAWITFQYQAGRLADKLGAPKIILLSQVLAVVVMVGLSLTTSIMMLPLIWAIMGLSLACWIPSFNMVVANLRGPELRGLTFAKVNMFRSFVTIPFPLLGGYLYENVMVNAPFIIGIPMMVISMIVVIKCLLIK